MDEWLSITQAMSVTGWSERTIRRHIKDGKMQTRLLSGRRQVLITDDMAQPDDNRQSPDRLIHQLQSENEYLRSELKSARERTDTIILHLTQQLEQQQSLLEYKKAPWWRRWNPRIQKPP